MARGRKSPLGIEGTGVSYRDPDEKGRPTCAMVRAKDEAGRWQVKRFAVTSWDRKTGAPVLPDAAEDWARSTRKDFVKGVAVAGAATFKDYADALVVNLRAAGVGEARLDLINNVADGLAAEGITDMKADGFPARVLSWITKLKAGWSQSEGDKNRRTTHPPLSAATRNKILVICRQVTGLAVKKRRLPYDPLDEIERFKERSTLKPLFSISELRQMVSDEARDHNLTERAALEAEIASRPEARTVAIKAIAKDRKVHWATIYNALRRPALPDPWWLACCLLVYTGCRADEATHLRWEWIRWDQRIITLKLADDYENKSDAERLIPLEPELYDILKPMMRPHGHILAPEIRAGGSGMKVGEKSAAGQGARDYTCALRLYLTRIGMDPKDRTAHSLRHCYITLKLARGDTNVERLRKVVGHADFSTTMGYGKLSQHYEHEVDQWPDGSLWLRRRVPAAQDKLNINEVIK